MIDIVPFSTLDIRLQRRASPTESPWKWVATFRSAAMAVFWGPRGPSVAAAKGSFARNLGENVLFDFHQTTDGWMVFMTNDVEI